MAAEQLEKKAKELNHTIKVETQGSMGIENELSQDEINNADYVVFAADIDVEKKERFEGKQVIEVSVQEAIKHPDKVFGQMN
jgi:fructose-specific phosphotransferase system IIB component